MLRFKLALVAAAVFSIAGCGGDDSSSGPGGAAGTGGSGGSGGTSGGMAGTSGGGQGGQGGSTTGSDASTNDASSGADTRGDSPSTSDVVSTDRGTTLDTSSPDATRDTTTTTDAPSGDGSSNDTTTPPSDGGGSDGTGPSDAPVGDASSTFVLTSSTITQGMPFPADHTCAGTNVSPPLTWTAGPPGTLSYAITLTDKSFPLVHSAIYDIPANVTSLPPNVEKVANPSVPAGAKQVASYQTMVIGYNGPCPGPAAHTYEFMVYAVDVAVLPGITTASTRTQLVTALQAHDLATATLSGTATSFR